MVAMIFAIRTPIYLDLPGRYWLDMFVVSMSLVSLVLTNEPTGVVRVMRALRVLRLFGRLRSLRKIFSALALAIVPVLNVFIILFILGCICGSRDPRIGRPQIIPRLYHFLNFLSI